MPAGATSSLLRRSHIWVSRSSRATSSITRKPRQTSDQTTSRPSQLSGEHPVNAIAQTPPTAAAGVGRKVVFRKRGQTHGPFSRMVSPGDLGQTIKPFVALDLVDTQEAIGQEGYGWHPHSGIATLTLAIEGRGGFAESMGQEGTMVAGDIEWLSAGSGVWHSGFAVPPIKAFQLWVALSPERELTPAFSQHLSVNEIPSDGPARVLLGRSGEAVSPIDAPPGINYFIVQLKAGERWTYQPPEGYLVGWV